MSLRSKAIRCAILGHDWDVLVAPKEPRFQKIWSDFMGEFVWYEVFDRKCGRCNQTWRNWVWTRAAAKKMIEVEP